MKRTLAGAGLAVLAALTMTGCSESFTFEAVPSGVSDDAAEEGLKGNPRQYDCFTIEADSSTGDEGDVSLGEFCRTGPAQPSNDADTEADDDTDGDD